LEIWRFEKRIALSEKKPPLVAQILNLLKIGDDENRQQNDGLTLFSSHFGEILDQLVKI
jgi:hypothetical protein